MLKNRSFARCRREMRSGVGGEELGEDAPAQVGTSASFACMKFTRGSWTW